MLRKNPKYLKVKRDCLKALCKYKLCQQKMPLVIASRYDLSMVGKEEKPIPFINTC